MTDMLTFFFFYLSLCSVFHFYVMTVLQVWLGLGIKSTWLELREGHDFGLLGFVTIKTAAIVKNILSFGS